MALLLLLIDGQMEINIDGQTTINSVNIPDDLHIHIFFKINNRKSMNKKAKPLRKTDSRTDILSSLKIQKMTNLFTLGQIKLYMRPVNKSPKKKMCNFFIFFYYAFMYLERSVLMSRFQN